MGNGAAHAAGLTTTLERSMRRILRTLVPLGLLSLACDQPAGPAGPIDRGPATLTIQLTDAPGDIQAAVVTIAEVYLQGSGGRTVLRSTPYTVDLVPLATTSTVLLEDVPVPEGNYEQLRFVITGAYVGVEDAAGGTQLFATSPDYEGLPAGVAVDGTLQLPSYSTSGLKVILPNGGLQVPSTGTVSLLVDFDVSQSFGHPAGRSGMWVMHPVIKATNVTGGTTLTATLALGSGATLPAGVTLADFSATLAPASAPGTVLASLGFSDPDGDGTFTAAFGFVLPGDYAVDIVKPGGVTGVTIDPAVPYAYTAVVGPGTTLAFTVEPVLPPVLNLVGDAATVGGAMRLTPASTWKLGGAWTADKQDLQNGFDAAFQFQITGASGQASCQTHPGADGFAFVVQNAAADALGANGKDIGYGGIPSSLALEFDTWCNQDNNDPNGNHLSVQTRGADPNSSNHQYSLGTVTAPFDLAGGAAHTVRIHYVPGTFEVFLDGSQTAILSVPVDLGNIGGASLLDAGGAAWVGFTASTGVAFENHDISNWAFAVK
jgi:hypothetical protein